MVDEVTKKPLEPRDAAAVSEQSSPTTLGGNPAADPLQVQWVVTYQTTTSSRIDPQVGELSECA
jgi:hypothetical protein